MTTKTKISIALPFLIVTLLGCRSNAHKTPNLRESPVTANTKPEPQDCDAISDPAAAEDCRFKAEVIRKTQKSNASPVVRHAPGTIKQP